MPLQRFCEIITRRELVPGIFSMTLEAGEIASAAQPGQFIHIKCGDHLLLRRPISICNAEGGLLEIVFEAVGQGTEWLSQRAAGESLDILGPLGRDYEMPEGNILVVGGGIGVPPLYYAAKAAGNRVSAVLGFRSMDRIILKDEFEAVCDEVDITTDDGSFGEHGFVTAPLRRRLEVGGVRAVLSCGPKAMLRAVSKVCYEFDVPCQVSLEERMGCGVGACLVCACKVKRHDGYGYAHVCKDGPVFRAEEVLWDE